MPTATRYRLPLLFLAAALFLLLQIWLFRPVTADYFPNLDELAVQGASNPALGTVDTAAWWRQGFHGYFSPFPEWPTASSDFWRPLVNVYYWVSGSLFRDHWADQLFVGYAMHALVASLIAYIAWVVLRLNAGLTLAVVAIALLNPSYVLQDILHDPYRIPRALQYPVYQVEVLDTLLALLSVLALMRRRFVWFGLLATVALLFKETALALPLCALALPAVWRVPEDRHTTWKNLCCVLAPLFIWGAAGLLMVLRLHESTYLDALRTSLHALVQLPRRVLLWPTGLMQASIADVVHAVRAHQLVSLLWFAFAGLLDLAWWIALLYALRYLVRERGTVLNAVAPDAGAIALVFAAGSLLFTLLLAPAEIRFGYLWFALGPAAVFWVLGRTRAGSVAALGLSLCLILPLIHSLGSALSSDSMDAYRVARRGARQLTQLLGTLPAGTQQVYLADDMVDQTSSSEYLARVAGFRGRIVLLNILAPVPGCHSTPADGQSHYRLVSDASGTTLEYHRPACFQAPWNVPPVTQLDPDQSIARGAELTYHYPDLAGSSTGSSHTNDPADLLSAHFLVHARDPLCRRSGACVWVGLDPASGRYGVLQAETGSAQ